jgi:predicted DNA-binding ribbon-helix-helix protein
MRAGDRTKARKALSVSSILLQCRISRLVRHAGRRTSVSLEDAFWKCLQEIAAAKEMKLSELVASIDKDRQQGNLSSHIRLHVLEYYQTQAAAPKEAEQTISSTAGTSTR